MNYATYSPEARTAMQAEGKTDDQIANVWATTNPGFKVNIEKIRSSTNNNPKATTAFLNRYLYGDAQYSPQANSASPKLEEDTRIGWLGSNALKRFLNKTWDYTQTDYQAKQAEIAGRYQSGQQGALNTMAQGALATVSGIAGPAKALWDVALTSDIPFTDTSAADVIQPVAQGVLESRPGQAAMEKVGQWQEFSESRPWAQTVNAGAQAGFDAALVAGSGLLEKPFQAAKGFATAPIQSTKALGAKALQVRPIEAVRNIRSGTSVGSVTTDAMKRVGVDERLAKILTEGGADTPAYKRIIQSYEKAATDFRATNPKEVVGETAIMTYRHLEDLRKGVGGLIGNVVKAHADETVALKGTYQKFVSWLEERGVYVSQDGKLERLGSSIPESDVRYLQGLHNDIVGVQNFKQADNIRRVIFKEQDLAKRQGVEFGDDAKQAAQAVHSSMLEEMGNVVPAYRVYAEPYARIRKAQNAFAQKLGKGSYKELDIRKLRAGEIAKRMTGEASADMTDTFQLLEDTARSFGYEAGTSVKNQAIFERAISRYFPTYSQGGLAGEVQAATMKTAVDAGLAVQTGSPYAIARVAGDVIKKLTGKSAERQLKVIKDFLSANADDLAKATTSEQVEAILQKMFGENYVAPEVRSAKVGEKESRLIELKGGKQGRPGIDQPAPLPQEQAQMSPSGGRMGGMDATTTSLIDQFDDPIVRDAAVEVINRGGKINPDGTITVYHRTSPEAKAAIEKTGEMTAKENGLFFSTRPDGQATGYGDAVVEMRIPFGKLELDDVFANEAHLRFPISKAGAKVNLKQYISASTPSPKIPKELEEIAGEAAKRLSKKDFIEKWNYEKDSAERVLKTQQDMAKKHPEYYNQPTDEMVERVRLFNLMTPEDFYRLATE